MITFKAGLRAFVVARALMTVWFAPATAQDRHRSVPSAAGAFHPAAWCFWKP